MPIIREYNRQYGDTPGIVQTRQRTSDDFGGREARAIGQLGQGMQQFGDALYKRAEQEELSDLNAKLSEVQKENTLEYEQLIRKAVPGDKEIFKDYDQKARERIDKVGEGLSTRGGREYYKETSYKLKNQMELSAARVQADLDGEKAVLDYSNTLNNLSASLLSDPSNLENNLEMHSNSIDQLVNVGLLPAKDGAKLKQTGEVDLVKAYLRGWTKLDPEFAREKIKSGMFDKHLGGDLKMQMYGEVDQAIRAREIEDERRKRREEELRQERQKITQNKFLKKMTDNDLVVADIMNSDLEPFGSGSKEQFLNMLKAKNKRGAPKTNPAVFADLFEKINLPDGDPKKITDENDLNQYVISGQLAITDLNHLRAEITGTKSEKGRFENEMKKQLFNFAKSRLSKANPMLGIRDPEGEQRFLAYQQFVFEQMSEYRKEGKPISNLLNPSSKEYIGNYVSQYSGSLQDIMKANVRAMNPSNSNTLTGTVNGNPPKKIIPRNPGESAKDYLDRIKAASEAEAGQ